MIVHIKAFTYIIFSINFKLVWRRRFQSRHHKRNVATFYRTSIKRPRSWIFFEILQREFFDGRVPIVQLKQNNTVNTQIIQINFNFNTHCPIEIYSFRIDGFDEIQIYLRFVENQKIYGFFGNESTERISSTANIRAYEKLMFSVKPS